MRPRISAAAAVLAAAAAMLLPAPLALGGGAAEEPVTVSLGYSGPADPGRNPAHRFAEAFAATLAEAGGDRLSLLRFPEDQLGTPRELSAVDGGELGDGPVLAVVPAAVLEERFAPISAASLPFLFDDRRAARAFFDESIFFERLAAQLAAEAGLTILAEVEGDGGVGVSTAERAVRTPADFEGLSLVTPQGRFAGVVESFGARAVLPGEAPQTVDGRVGTEAGLLAAGLQTAFPYRSRAGIAFPRSYLVVNTARFAALSAEDRRLIRDAAAGAMRRHRAAVEERIATVRAALEAAGVRVYTPTAAERAELRRIARPAVIDELEARVELEWITLALEEAENPSP
jgi:TRAP-type C4-dicarboxylate transport system substrate-binding protein